MSLQQHLSSHCYLNKQAEIEQLREEYEEFRGKLYKEMSKTLEEELEAELDDLTDKNRQLALDKLALEENLEEIRVRDM